MPGKLPGRNKTIRTQRRKAIAEKLVAQKTPQEIGREIGLSRQMVNVEIRADETQGYIRGAMAPYRSEIAELIPSAIAAVRDGLNPAQLTVDRLRAVKSTGYLMELAEGRDKNGDLADRPARFSGTMEELLVLYRKTTLESVGA